MESGTPNFHYIVDRNLSAAAQDLLAFDAGSLNLLIAAESSPPPSIWLADTDLYEKNGRVLRDSESPRLLAYVPQTNTVYATDGCNSCASRTDRPIESLTEKELRQFALENELRFEILQRLAELASAYRGN